MDCFENFPEFNSIKYKAFQNFMDKNGFPKILSNYIDFCMKDGFKGKTDEEIEISLNDIINLYKYITNRKLIFGILANKKLNDRLIQNTYFSLNAEKKLISKLKQESDTNSVKKMMMMIDYVEKNNKILEQYRLSPSKGAPNGIKFNVLAINLKQNWEVDIKYMEKIQLPKFLSSCIEDFEKFYLSKNSHKLLSWFLGYSKLEIQFLYLKDKNISISTLIQYLILLYLEKRGALSIQKLSFLLGCQTSTILEDINGLVFNPSYNPNGDIKKGVIIDSFNGENKTFNEKDTISINKCFSVSLQKFSTLPVDLKPEKVKILLEYEEEFYKRYKNNIIQSTMTRIMKSRIGEITTTLWLIDETIKQIDLFEAQVEEIKENIGRLIYKNIIRMSKNYNDSYCKWTDNAC